LPGIAAIARISRFLNKMKNNHFYTTKFVLDKVGVTRSTLYKWFKNGKIDEVYRDRNDNRLFSAKDIEKITRYKNLIKKVLSNNNKKYNRKI